MSEMLWGGRFAASPSEEMLRLTSSIGIDIRLLEQDVAATKAHARVLVKAGLLEPSELPSLDAVCDSIVAEWRAGRLDPLPMDEDVHSLVERILTERLGETGARIHTGRSRNDLVAADLRLWCKENANTLAFATAELLDVISAIAERNIETLMPGYTHLQRAQPVTLGFHLLAHGFALHRDGKRFVAAAEAADVSTLGAGAVAGTTLELDSDEAASHLGFAAVFDNAMDAVSDRDFIADLLYACALCGVHLSRLAEEIVLWTSMEFAFARLDDAWSTGSSMMPQKRNPDLAELLRGRAAGGVADLVGLLTLLKSLPLAYDRDLQEDKTYVFSSVDRTHDALSSAAYLLQSLAFDSARLDAASRKGASWATDLAEALVARGVPFREAHGAVGRLVGALDERNAELADLEPAELATFHDSFRDDDLSFADPRAGLMARASHGGPAPERVREQLDSLRTAADVLRRRGGD